MKIPDDSILADIVHEHVDDRLVVDTKQVATEQFLAHVSRNHRGDSEPGEKVYGILVGVNEDAEPVQIEGYRGEFIPDNSVFGVEPETPEFEGDFDMIDQTTRRAEDYIL